MRVVLKPFESSLFRIPSTTVKPDPLLRKPQLHRSTFIAKWAESVFIVLLSLLNSSSMSKGTVVVLSIKGLLEAATRFKNEWATKSLIVINQSFLHHFFWYQSSHFVPFRNVIEPIFYFIPIISIL